MFKIEIKHPFYSRMELDFGDLMIKILSERSYKHLDPSTKTKGKLLKINTAGPWYNVTFI